MVSVRSAAADVVDVGGRQADDVAGVEAPVFRDGVGGAVDGDGGAAVDVVEEDGALNRRQRAVVADGHIIQTAHAVDIEPPGGGADGDVIHAGSGVDGGDEGGAL